eukprot:bmy_21383T0
MPVKGVSVSAFLEVSLETANILERVSVDAFSSTGISKMHNANSAFLFHHTVGPREHSTRCLKIRPQDGHSLAAVCEPWRPRCIPAARSLTAKSEEELRQPPDKCASSPSTLAPRSPALSGVSSSPERKSTVSWERPGRTRGTCGELPGWSSERCLGAEYTG